MIAVTVLLLITNQMELRLVHDQMKNCVYVHILFDLKGIRNCISLRVAIEFKIKVTVNILMVRSLFN